MNRIEFIKMHGLGNDFVVIDCRTGGVVPDGDSLRWIADRRRGVGFDQFLTIETALGDADAFMRIHNPDGSEAEACGNGTRCVAALLMAESGQDTLSLETLAGVLTCTRDVGGQIAVDMGPAVLDWAAIPLALAADSLHVDLPDAPFSDACCVAIGNPHAVFFVADAEAVDLAIVGPALETHPMFPARANIEFVSVTGPDRLRMRVWERAAGITQACGSGACASAVAAVRRGLTGRQVSVDLDGGTLGITWRDDGHVMMRGPTAISFTGQLDLRGMAS